MLKFIQKWLHNNFLKKYGFGWLYWDFFFTFTVASDKAYQLLAHGRWFSPASSTTKTGRHDIAEGGVKHQKSNQSIIFYFMRTQQIENKQ
jgi:hypothetical protein